MGMVDLADDGPLAFYLQQVEEVGEAEPRDVVGIDPRTGRRADDVDAHDGGFGFRGWAERGVDDVVEILDRAADEFVAIDAEHRGLLVEGGLHQCAVGLGATFVVLVKHIDNRVVFLNVSKIAHCMTPDK